MRGQRIDTLLAPLLLEADDEEADEFLARKSARERLARRLKRCF